MKKASVRTVRLSGIRTDPDVNRPLDPAWVNYLVKNWDPTLFGIPDVATHNGHFIIIDGQHRLAALGEQEVGDPRVSVNVHEGLTKPEMARTFVEKNHVRSIRPFQKFVKLVYALDPDAVTIANTLKMSGLHLAVGASPGSVSCVVALQRVFRMDGTSEILHRALTVLTQAWGHEAANFQGDIVQGVGLLIHHHPELDDKALASGIAKHPAGPSGLLGKARTIREIQGGSVAGGVAEAARNIYNRGRRTRRLED